MSNNNSNLKTNTTSLQELLNVVNNLPEASDGVELPELTNEGTASDLLLGKELIDGDGNKVTGTFTINEELITQEMLLSDQDAKLAELAEILSNKASVSPVLQSKTITPTTAEQIVTADSGYDALGKVTVKGDSNLKAENIKSGVSIFGVNGTLTEGGSGSSGGGSVETCMVNIGVKPKGPGPVPGQESPTYHYLDKNFISQSITTSTPITIEVIKNSIIVIDNYSSMSDGEEVLSSTMIELFRGRDYLTSTLNAVYIVTGDGNLLCSY